MRAVFLDRDGTINELVYQHKSARLDSPFDVSQVKVNPRVRYAIKALAIIFDKIIIVSNQPGIAKGHFTEETLEKITQEILLIIDKHGKYIDDVIYCKHHPEGLADSAYTKECLNRKPNDGMLRLAREKYDLDLAECFMIGDRLTDIAAGKKANCRTILISNKKRLDMMSIMPDYIAKDLASAVEVIKKNYE